MDKSTKDRVRLLFIDKLLDRKMRLKIKPLSINDCFQWRRYKTKEYKYYEAALIAMLPNLIIPKDVPLGITITYWFATLASDIDNPSKPLLDILQKKYGIDDKRFFEKHEYKKVVWFGKEFIEIQIWVLKKATPK